MKIARVLLAAALLALPLYACAQPGMMYGQGQPPPNGYAYGPGYDPGWGMGPGMMGPYAGYGEWERGYGPGYGEWGPGYGPGPGMGPGMMGGYGPGWGHMRYGMGPGMMRGYGWGPGMRGYGFGPGADYGLDLSDAQRDRLSDIQHQLRDRQFEIQRELYDQQARLYQLYQAERLDPKQIGEAYATIGKLRQQLAQEAAEAHNRMLDVLSDEQRAQLRQWRREAYGAGPGTGRAEGPGRQSRR